MKQKNSRKLVKLQQYIPKWPALKNIHITPSITEDNNLNRFLIMQLKLLNLNKNSLASFYLIISSSKFHNQLSKVQLFSKVDMFIQAIGKIIKEMEKENKFGKMDLSIKATGKIILLMAMVG